MDDRLKQSISALMDDEANELELQRVLSQIDDEEVSSVWDSYHRIGDVIRNDNSAPINIDISAHVSQAIRSESDQVVYTAESKNAVNESIQNVENSVSGASHASVSWKPWLAAAASVALVIGMTVQNRNHDTHSNESLNASVVTEQGSGFVKVGHASLEEANQSINDDLLEQPIVIAELSDAQARQLGRYLLRHAEHAVRGTQSGFVPLARVASVNSVGI